MIFRVRSVSASGRSLMLATTMESFASGALIINRKTGLRSLSVFFGSRHEGSARMIAIAVMSKMISDVTPACSSLTFSV